MAKKTSESDIRGGVDVGGYCPITQGDCTLKELDEQLLRLSQNALFKLRLAHAIVARAVEQEALASLIGEDEEVIHEDI